MFKHILLPTDGSPLSDRAVRQAIKLAKALGAKITALHVIQDYGRYLGERYDVPASLAVPLKKQFQEEAEANSKDILEHVYGAAMVDGVACERVSVVNDSPSEAIVDQAKARGCDVIMMASHGRRGLQALLLGSEAHKVLVHSGLPVLVCR